MKYYHAATPETMMKITNDAVLKRGWDGLIYLCRKPEDAAKFVAIRGNKRIDVIEVKLNEKDVEESNDHSEAFFGCKAYTYAGDIPLNGREKISEYEVIT